MSEIMWDPSDVLDYIASYRKRMGYPPSRREVAAEFGVSLNTAQRMFTRLVEEGLITIVPTVSRAVNITESGMKAVEEYI